MADTTTPVTPVIPAAQDLQINLEDAPKTEKIQQPETWNLKSETELDLSLDLNLPEVPKIDDRLKAENQKNTETVVTPTVNETPAGVEEEVEIKFESTPEVKIEETPASIIEPIPEIVVETPKAEVEQSTVVEQEVEIPTEAVAEVKVETSAGVEQPSIVSEPSTKIEAEPITTEAPTELKEDMKIIDDLEWHASAGGLAPEATVVAQPTLIEAPKTFDLDAMLGSPATPPVVEIQPVAQTPIEMSMPAAEPTPVPPPAFTIPTPTSEVPVQAVPQIIIPQKKNVWVKALLFVVLFVALGFTTFFILKTMYPVEFGNIFSGGETQMHAIEEVTGTIEELTANEFTGTEISTEQMSGEIDTGTHESPVDNIFWELNDLGATSVEPEQNDVSKLTNYVNMGNNFLAQGKAIGNNTVIKFALYISKKSTWFLEKIANGEEISNLSWYFAQFDQYIAQLETLLGTNTTAPVTEPVIDEETSSLSQTINDQSMNQGSTPTPTVTTE